MITAGVIGVGRWGPNILRNLVAMENVSVKMVCDSDPGRLQPIRKRFQGIQTTTDPDHIFSDSAITCTLICTPVTTHFELARSALQAGQQVFVEKPLAATAQECRELIKLAEKAGKILFTGHTFLYNAGIRAAREYIERGELGEIFFIDAKRTNLGPVRYDVNALWDLASHDISIFSYWLSDKPKSVSARGGCYLKKTIEDVVFATFSYGEGICAHVHASWLNPRKVREITVVGEQKMLIWDDMNLSEPIRIYNRGFSRDEDYHDTFASFRLSIRDGDVIIPSIQLNEPLLQECQHFIECVAEGKQPLTDGYNGLAVVEALEAATKSLKEDSRAVPVG